MTEQTKDKSRWALDCAREKGLRRTRAMEALISFLAESARPVSWTHLTAEPRLAKICDPATVFRLLQRLEKIGLVRKLGLHSRSMHYYLNAPGDHHHHEYLVCSDCGAITELDIHCPVGKLQDDIARKSGFKNLYHELEFYGVCPKCQSSPP
ncbi:Fur family transcriptional regulator [Kamptonema cortianum]|nr:Fur family transcriptional regulator [Oscillatoria laete-virens]MDK3161854.1 Fur family transcriptional regulator [Kamptonema cortianum]MDL5054424.1 Fur family transcriptional regulator [Oscillatoria laete-virens NRMC-F 0139]